MYTYETVSEAISDLKQRGYTLDFNLEENALICLNLLFDCILSNFIFMKCIALKIIQTLMTRRSCLLLKVTMGTKEYY